jgi:hypothetical protein
MAIQLTASNAAAFNHAGHRDAAMRFPRDITTEYQAGAKILLVMAGRQMTSSL